MPTPPTPPKEGGLAPPTRHPLNWQAPEFYDPAALNAELERVFDLCHGCRRCVSLCHAFPTLFDLIDASETMEIDGVAKADYGKVVDHCYLCDLCYQTKCPYIPPHEWNIDFPHLMLRAKAVKHRNGGVTSAQKLLASTDAVGKLAAIPIVVNVVNAANNNKPLRKVLERVLGVHRNAALPTYHRKTLRRRHAKSIGGKSPVASPASATVSTPSPSSPSSSPAPPTASTPSSSPASSTASTSSSSSAPASTTPSPSPSPPPPTPTPRTTGKVAIFATCFGNYNEPHLGEDLISVLQHNHIEVALVPSEQCCGMPKLELGDLPAVERAMQANIPPLLDMVKQGYDLLAPVPSCVLMFRQELPLLFPQHPAVQQIARHIFDPFEYLIERHQAGHLNTHFPKPLGKVAYHAACHQRVQKIGMKTQACLQLIPNTEILTIERCSGHDGTYGVKKISHQIATQIARPVVTKIKTFTPDHYGSDCPMAGRFLQHGLNNNTQTEHPISLLRLAYAI